VQKLVEFIKQYLEQGYDIDSIRAHLINSGYSQNDINSSISKAYSTTHVVHHLSKTTVLTLLFVVIGLALVVASLVIYLKPGQEAILDIKLEPVQTTVMPGQEIVFIRELTNFGKRVDATTSYSLVTIDTSSTITSYQETAAVETKASKQIKIKIPDDAAPGNAVLNAVSVYDGKEAKAALTISIYEESVKSSCTDKIQNQNEEGVDCGGACKPCEAEKKCPPSCNDYDLCTEDYCDENSECKHKQIMPCCGNNICEESETPAKCSKDCIEQQTDMFEGLTLTETLDKIKKISETDVRSAANYCDMVDIAMYRDSCFRNIAEVAKNAIFCDKIAEELSKDRCYASIAKAKIDSSACEGIAKESIRDSCYMNFVLDQKDYSVCDKLVNSYLRDSCQTLNQAQAI